MAGSRRVRPKEFRRIPPRPHRPRHTATRRGSTSANPDPDNFASRLWKMVPSSRPPDEALGVGESPEDDTARDLRRDVRPQMTGFEPAMRATTSVRAADRADPLLVQANLSTTPLETGSAPRHAHVAHSMTDTVPELSLLIWPRLAT